MELRVPNLTADELYLLVEYNPDSGEFIWLPRRHSTNGWNKRWAGKLAGYKKPAGRKHTHYYVISIDNVDYTAHRLAWLYMTGEWPDGYIDHKDCDGTNNRWANLRLATVSQNGANSRSFSNPEKPKGVGFYKQRGCWRARVGQKHIGYYDTKEEAMAAYRIAAKNKWGEFARVA